MSADRDPDELDGPRRGAGRGEGRPRRACRPLWLGGMPEPGPPHEPGAHEVRGPHEEGAGDGDRREHDPATCDACDPGLDGFDDLLGEPAPEPDLGEIVVILLVSTLTGLRDRLERDGFGSAAALVHDLVEVADDYVMRFQP